MVMNLNNQYENAEENLQTETPMDNQMANVEGQSPNMTQQGSTQMEASPSAVGNDYSAILKNQDTTTIKRDIADNEQTSEKQAGVKGVAFLGDKIVSAMDADPEATNEAIRAELLNNGYSEDFVDRGMKYAQSKVISEKLKPEDIDAKSIPDMDRFMDSLELAGDIKGNIERLYDTDVWNAIKSTGILGVENSAEAKIHQKRINATILKDMVDEGMNVEMRDGDFYMKGPDGKEYEIDEGFWDTVAKMGGEIGGGIVGGIAGGALGAASPVPFGTVIGARYGSAIGAGLGRGIDSKIAAHKMKTETDTAILLTQMASAFGTDLIGGKIIDLGLTKGISTVKKTAKGIMKAVDSITTSGLANTRKALLELAGVGEKEADEILDVYMRNNGFSFGEMGKVGERKLFERFKIQSPIDFNEYKFKSPVGLKSKDVIGLKDVNLPTVKRSYGVGRRQITKDELTMKALAETSITDEMLQTLQTASKEKPRIVKNILAPVNARAKAVKKLGKQIRLSKDVGQDVVDTYGNYEKAVSNIYGEVQEVASSAMKDADFTLDIKDTVINPLKEMAQNSVSDVMEKDRVIALFNNIENKTTSRNFDDLLELKKVLNKFKYTDRAYRRMTPDGKEAIEETIKIVKHNINTNLRKKAPKGEDIVKALGEADAQYHKMKIMEDNVIVQAFKGTKNNEEDILKVLNKFGKNFRRDMSRLDPVKKRLPSKAVEMIDAENVNNIITKYTIGDSTSGNQAIDFKNAYEAMKDLSLGKGGGASATRALFKHASEKLEGEKLFKNLAPTILSKPEAGGLALSIFARQAMELVSKATRTLRMLAPDDVGKQMAIVRGYARLFDEPLNPNVKDELVKTIQTIGRKSKRAVNKEIEDSVYKEITDFQIEVTKLKNSLKGQ